MESDFHGAQKQIQQQITKKQYEITTEIKYNTRKISDDMEKQQNFIYVQKKQQRRPQNYRIINVLNIALKLTTKVPEIQSYRTRPLFNIVMEKATQKDSKDQATE